MDTITLNNPDSLDAIRNLLDSDGVTEALKAGSSLTLSWNSVEISNPRHNHTTGATDDHGDEILDEREDVYITVPRLEITGKTKFEEHSVVTDLTREIESRDPTLTSIEDSVEAINRRLRNLEEGLDDDDDPEEFAREVARYVETEPKRRSPFVAIIWTLLIFVLGALYGSANAVQVSTLFGRFLQLFS